jgi:hypothetical protein
MAWAVTVCLGFAAVLTITLFRLLELINTWGVFFFYAGLNLVAFVLILLFVPETKGYTLEELDYVFGVPNKTFINHTLTKSVPYFVKHTVFRQDMERPNPLIQEARGFKDVQGPIDEES